jgi:hypothetical protein
MEKLKKYKVIAKVNNDKFVKYHINNLLSFTTFLDTKYPEWRYFNVFNTNGQQIANYTKNNRPVTKWQ